MDTLEITVTSLADSGAGSLREVLQFANSAPSYAQDINIILNMESLPAGGVIELQSALPAINSCALVTIKGPEGGVTLSGYGLEAQSNVELQNITLPELLVNGAASVSGSGVVFTGSGAVISMETYADLSGLSASATNADAYVYVENYASEMQLVALGEQAGALASYQVDAVSSWPTIERWEIGAGVDVCLLTYVSIYSGGSVVLGDGAHLSTLTGDVEYIQGGLSVGEGSALTATNAVLDIPLSFNNGGYITEGSSFIYACKEEPLRCTLAGDEKPFENVSITMAEGAVLQYCFHDITNTFAGDLSTITSEKMAILTENGQRLIALELSVQSGEVLTVEEGVQVCMDTFVYNGTMHCKAGSIINGEVFVDGTKGKVISENATFEDLTVYGDAQMEGSFKFSGVVSFSSISDARKHLSDITYETIGDNVELNIEDYEISGVSVLGDAALQGGEFEGFARLTYSYVTVDSGELAILNNLHGEDIPHVSFDENASMIMNGCVLSSDYYIYWPGGSAEYNGVDFNGSEFYASIWQSGEHSLKMTGCTNLRYFILDRVMSGELSIILTGNDFSQTEFSLYGLPESCSVDLSGNYWGTTDMEEIRARLGEYADSVILTSVLDSPPQRTLELTVSTDAAEGEGSLAAALAAVAQAVPGQLSIITMDEALAGKSLQLAADLHVTGKLLFETTVPVALAAGECRLSIAEGAYMDLDQISLQAESVTVAGCLSVANATISCESSLSVAENAIVVLQNVEVDSIQAAAGAELALSDCSGISALTLDLAGKYHFSGNDFTDTEFTFTGQSNGTAIDFVDCQWGTEDLNSLFARFGEYADCITVDGKAYVPGGVVTVTNTAEYGTGSLSWALERAANSAGNVVVRFDESLAGQVIELTSPIVLGGDCSIENLAENPVTITGEGIETGYTLTMTNMVLPSITLNGTSAAIAGSGNVLTDSMAIVLESCGGEVRSALNPGAWSASAGDAYALISSVGDDCVFEPITDILPGGYHLDSYMSILNSVTLVDGACLNTGDDNGSLYICDDFSARFETQADAIVGNDNIYVRDGADVLLRNANLRASHVSLDSASLTAVGGTIGSSLYVGEWADAALSGVTVEGSVVNYHTLSLSDVVILEALEVGGDTTVQGVSCGTLALGAGQLSVADSSDLTLTSSRAVSLSDGFTGLVSEVLGNIPCTIVAEDAYVSIGGALGTCTLDDVSSMLPGGYMIDDYTSIASGEVVTLGGGISLASEWVTITVDGSLRTLEGGAPVSISGGNWQIADGGSIELSAAELSEIISIDIESGGSFSMQGGSLSFAYDYYGLYITNGGAELSLQDCDLSGSNIFISGTGSTITLTNAVGLTSLALTDGNTYILENCDFSQTEFSMDQFYGNSEIVFTNCFWGTEDTSEILNRFGEYADSITIDGFMEEQIVEIPVTTVEGDGPGSLAAALARAALLPAYCRAHIILDESLSGQTITLATGVEIVSQMTIEAADGAPVNIGGGSLMVSGPLELINVNVPTVELKAGGSLSGTNAGSTAQGVFLILDGFSGDTAESVAVFGENAYAEGNYVLVKSLPYGELLCLSNPAAENGSITYRLSSDEYYSIEEGGGLEVGAGTILDVCDAYMYVWEGGTFHAQNAVVHAPDSWGGLDFYNGSSITVENSELAVPYLYFNDSDVQISNSEIAECYSIWISGTTCELNNCGISCEYVSVSDRAEVRMSGCVISNDTYISHYGAKLILDGVVCNGVIDSYGDYEETALTIRNSSISGNILLSLVPGVSYVMEGNDFSGATFEFNYVEEGYTINFVDCVWGTEDLNEIFARFGDCAEYVRIDGQSVPVNDGIYEVTNAEASGAGSLAQALAAAALFDGAAEIRFAASLEGAELSLDSSQLSFAKSMKLVNAGSQPVTLSGVSISSSADLHLEGIALQSIALSGSAKLSGSGVVLTGSGAVLSLPGPTTDVSNFAASATQEGAYIYMNGGSISADACLVPLGQNLSEYRFNRGIDVVRNVHLAVAEGASLSFLAAAHDVSVSGTLEVSGALNLLGASSGDRVNVYIHSGGEVLLRGASVRGSASSLNQDSSGNFLVYNGGKLTVDSCTFTDSDGIYVVSGGVLTVTESQIDSWINLHGTASISNTTLQNLTSTGSLTMESCELQNLTSTGSLTMESCELQNLTSGGITALDNVTMNYLTLSGGKVSGTATLNGSGRVITLSGAEANLVGLSATATQEGTYIGVTDADLNASNTFSVLGEGLDTYRLEQYLYVRNGATLTLAEGVVLESLHHNYDLWVDSGCKLEATGATLNLMGHNQDIGNALSYLYIRGMAELMGCTINAYAATHCNSYENIQVGSGGVLRMSDCVLNDVNYFDVESGGTASISNTTLQNLTSSGTLAMETCELQNLTSGGITALDNVTMNYLTLSGGKVSGTATLNGSGRVITLSGAEANLVGLSATATQEGTYIGVTDADLNASNTFSVLGEGLDTYRLEQYLYVRNGATLTLAEGVVLESLHHNYDLWVDSGGKLEATGATLNLMGHNQDIGNDLSYLYIRGMAELMGCTINAYAATHCNGYENIQVGSGGVLRMVDCQLNDVNYFEVESGGSASISNTTLQNLTSSGTLAMETCELQRLTSGGTTELDNVTMNYLTLSGGKVSGTATLNGSGRVITLSGAEANLSGLSATATQDGAYIGVTEGGLDASNTFSVLGEGLDTYRLETSLYVRNGATLTLGEGVVLESLSHGNDLNIYSGGKLVATGATLNLLGHYNESGYYLSELCVEGTAELSNCIINAYAANSCDGYENIQVRNGGNLSMESCQLNDVNYFEIQSGGTATISNTTLQNLTSAGTVVLDNATLNYLTLSGSKVSGTATLTGSGRVITLSNAEANVTELCATSTQDGAYIGVTEGGLDASNTFSVLGEGLDTYRLETSLHVRNGATLTLGEGVVLESLSHGNDLNIYSGGKLVATGATLNLLGHYNESGYYLSELCVEGTAELTNCTITAYAASNCDGYENIQVRNGGYLSMESCQLNDVNYFEVERGGSASICNTTLQNLTSAGTLVLENSTLSKTLIYSAGSLTGAGNTFVGTGAVIVLSSAEMDLHNFAATATQEGAYIAISDTNLGGKVAYTPLGEGLGTYRLTNHLHIDGGGELTLTEGTVLESSHFSHDIAVYDGGRLVADGATIRLEGHEDESGRSLSSLIVYSGAEVELVNTKITAYDATSIYTNVYRAEEQYNIYVGVGGKLSMTNTTLEDVNFFRAESGSELILNDSTLENLTALGSLQVSDSVVNKQLVLGGTVAGGGNTFTGTGAVIALSSADVDMSQFAATATQEGAYIAISDTNLGGKVAYTPLGEGLDTYRLTNHLHIDRGGELTLTEGSVLESTHFSHDIAVYDGGRLVADGATIRLDGHEDESGRSLSSLIVYSGAEVELTNTTITAYDATSIYTNVYRAEGQYNVYVGAGGKLSMTNTTLENVNFIQVTNDATLDIDGVTGLTGLSIYGGAMVDIKQTDFSGASFSIIGSSYNDNKIDLSGNYWGTTDYEEILAKISGYNADYVVLENWLVTAPENAVAIEGLVGDKLLDASENSVTLRFSEEMDATTTTVDKFSIVNELGEAVEITGFELNGCDVVLEFGQLPKDGTYRVSVANGLQSATGKSVQVYMSRNGASEYSETLRADVTPETVTAVSLQKSTQPRYVDVVFSGAVNPATAAVGLFVLRGPAGETVAVQSISTPGANTLRLNLPAFSAVGEYTLELLPGITDYAGNAVLLPEEPLSFTLESADVSVTAADVAYTGHTYGSVQVALTANNAGNAAATGAKVEIWLTKNGSIASDSILLDIVTVDLAAGEQKELTRTLLLEQAWDLAEGEYQLVTRSSWGDELSALRADNTAAIGTLSVSYPPAADLSISSMTLPDSLEPGQSFALQLQVANNGGQPTPAECQVELGLISSGADASTMISLGTYTLVASTTGAELAPGESLLLSVPAVQLPAGIALQGAVQVVAIVNPDNTVFEKPEHRVDNTFVAADVLQLEPTLSLSLSRSEVTEGSGLRVVYTITRSGDCSEALTVQVDCALAERLGLPETLTIAAGQSSLRYQAAPVNDAEYLGNASASVAISAAGYKGAQSSISLVEDEKPTLTLTLSAASAAEGTEITGTVTMNTISTVDTVVKLGSTYAAQLNLPATVTIKAGESSASFSATVVQDETAEIDKELKITAAATGFNSGTAKVTVVDDDIPQVELLLDKQLVSESDGVYAIIGTLKRTSGSSEPISVRLFDADGIGLLLPDTVRLAEGQTSMKFNIGIVDDNSANGSRSGAIRGEIILDSCGCDASSSPGGTFTSQPITITDNDSPSLRVSLSKTMIREGGGDEIVITVSTNHLSENDIVVNLSDNGFLELPSSIVISAGDSFATCVVRAKSDVVDSGTQTCLIAAESDGFQKGMGYAQVTDIDLPDLVVRSISVPDAAVAGQNIKVGIVIANQGYAVAYSGAGVDIKLSNGTSLGCVATDRDIDAGESIFVETELTLPDYAGAFHVIAEIDTSGRVTELNENNNISTSSYVLNVVSGFEVTAQITESEMTSSGGPAHINGVLSASVDGVSVGGQVVTLDVFLNGSYVRSSQVVTADDGSFSQVLEIPARVPGTYSIKARVMGETSDVLDSLVVSGMKCASPASNLAWLIEKDSSVTGKLSIKNIGAVDLHNVSLILNNLPDNIQITNVSAAQDIAVGKTVDFTFTIAGNFVNVGDLYSLIPIEVVCDEGEKLSVNAYSYVVTPSCDLSLSVNELHVDVNHEYARYIELTVTNYGNGDSGRVSLSLPDEEWLSLYSGNQIENLKCGESATIVLKVDASSANVLLGAPYKGSIVVNAENGSSQVLKLGINFVDSQKCSLKVNLKDTFGLQIGESVGLADTKVYLYDAYTQRLVVSAQSNERGEVYFGDLEAGKYYLNVDNEGYDFYQTNISLEPGQNLVHEAYLSTCTVKYTFTVVPVEIEDKYEIVHTVDFTTNVPAPVVVFEDSVIQIPDIGYGETVIVPFTVSNLGYVSARGYELLLPELSDLTLTILNPITELPALSSHEFFLQVTAPEKSESGDKSGLGTAIQQGYNLYRCLTGWSIQRWFDCSDDGRLHQVVTLVQTNQENCDALNSSNSGSVYQFGFSYVDGSHSSSGDYDSGRPSHANKGGSGQASTFTPPSPIEASENACSPCLALALNICRIIGENRKAISDLRDAINKAKKKTATKDDYKDLADNLRDIIESLEEEIGRLWDQLRRCYESLKNKGASRSVESEAQWLSLAMDLADYSLGELSRVYRAEGLRIWQDRDLEQLMRELSQNIQQNEASPDQVNAIVSEFIDVYEDATGVTCQYREEADLSIFSMKITEEFVTKLLSTQFGIIVGEEKLMQIVERWNRTVSYHEQGIYSEIDLPEGNNTDFYSTEYLADVFSEAAALYAELADKGYEDSASYLNHLVLDVEESVNGGAGDVCASVKIQFRQTSVMTREAFDGLLTLENGSALGDLTNIRFSVYVLDEHGTDVTDLFNISYYDLEGIDSLDGGVLASGAEGQVKIRYIPGRDVAPEASALFRFGANLSYNDPGTGLERSIVVTPVELKVNPSPSLDLHYFLSENSYSDDPYTATLEAVQKSELGLIVKNSGNGIARNFRMSDFHPTILENETGLAIELTMMGASLNGGELQKGGTVLDFGNIAANSTSTAIWYFSSNLHGYFSNYQATFTRVDMMGNEVYITNGTDVSLIENVNTHMLTRSLNVDGDEKTDFLVNDQADALSLADGIYFGDGSYADVNAVTGVLSRSGQLGEGVNTITLTMRMAEGWNYIRIDDPGMGDYCITGVTVGGVALDSSAFWQTDRIFAGDGTATYVSRLHWVYEAAEDGTVEVVLDYKPADTDIPRVVAIEGIENGQFLRELPQDISVRFSEAINPGTFNVGCVELRKGTERIDLAGLTWTWEAADTLVFTNLHEFMTADGVYSLAVRNTNVQDVYGNPGDGTGAAPVRWTLAAEAFAMEGVSGHEQRRENSYVETLYVSFTSSVAEFPADAITLYVTEPDGVTYSVNGAGKLTVTQSDTEGKVFAISGLEGLQVRDGSYSMSIDRSKVLDVNGNACLEFTPVTWELHKTPPTVLASSFVEAEQLVQNIDTVNLQFSHAVGRIDASAIIIRCNGEVYTSDSLVCEIHPDDPTLVIVRGISKATPVGKTAAMPDGEWQLSVDMTGVEDIYGNLGEGTYSADWAVDTIAPVALSGITVNGKDSLVVPHNVVTIGAELPESGLTVSIYDKLVTGSGLGTLLWSGVVAGTTLSQQVTLLSGASHTISVVTTDAAGNSTTSAYNVLVDMVVLTVSTDIEPEYMVMPDTVTITFSTETTDLALSAVQLTVGGKPVSLEGAALTRLSATEWQLSGLSGLSIPAGECALNIDLSTVSKTSSGLLGQGVYTKTFTYDPVSEVKITSCDITAEASVVKGLSIVFSAGINYAALRDSGALPEAVRLVNQADGSVVELDAAGFTYADKTLTWSGEQRLAGGTYAVVVDPALLTAVNGSPLVGNAGSALTSIVSYQGDAVLLGASGTSYSAPYAVDWNGDGYADLLVGEKVGSSGKVRLYLNNGSGGFSDYSYLQSNGADLSVAASGCQGVVVALQDITGDGVADLVAGLSNGAVQYYTGLEDGGFGAAAELVASSVAVSRAYPVFHDWNGDGVTDLVLGTGSGTLMVGLGSQDATTGALNFATPITVAGIEVSGRSAPVFTDVNGDGSADIILGAGDGSLTLYYATESGYYKTGSWQLDGIDWERSRVTVADLNADGKADLIVGGSTGEIYVVYGAAAGVWGESIEVESGSVISSTSVSVEGKAVTLSWAVDYAEAGLTYVVEVADNAGFANAIRQEVSTTALTLSNMAEGGFHWRVSIKDSAKPAVTGQNFTVDTIVPGAPAELTASAGNGAVVLSWSALDDASGVKYEVRYSATSDFSAATSVFSEGNEMTLSGLSVGTWYWQVRAVDGAGNAGEWTTAADSFSIDEFVAPESPSGEYWAQGLVVSDKQLVSGYWDADKTGTGDTQLCWAAVSSNMLAWWQTQYGVADFSTSEVPATADDIFATFRQNWANVSGREEYGLTWWVSGESENTSYGSFYSNNFTGSSEQGAYYAPHYDAAATTALVKEISLTGASAEQVARDWSAVYAEGGMMGLGIYRSLSGTTLIGGHTLTLWGFATDAAGRLTSITVSDSDDGTDGVLTLALAYNLTKGYYQIVQSGSKLNGCLLGDYTTLGAFDKADLEDNSAAGAVEITMSEPVNGVSKNTAEHYDWVGTGDTQDFYTFTAPGDGIYRVNVNTMELESALWMSVGTLDAAGEFVVTKQAQITPGAPISGISGLRLDSGEPQYICISPAEGTTGTAYELNITGDIDEASPITDNNVKRKATKLVGTIYADATVSSWVGSGDALDIYYFDLTEDCNFSLNLSELDKNAKVKLYYDYGDGSYGSIISTTVRAARGLSFADTLEQGTYYLEIASYDNGGGRYNTGYTLEMEKEIDGVSTRLSLESDSPFTDNNTKETATELELVPSTDAVITSWVGAGDALDCYSFNVNQAGTLSLCLSELEKNATVRLFQATEAGYQQTLSTTVRAARGLDTELTLATGTYFLEIASYDNGAGRYNTTYALELEKEEDGETKRYAIAGSGL